MDSTTSSSTSNQILATFDPSSNMNNTTLDPNSTSSLDPTILENFFHINPEKELATDTEEPEEDFSHLSLEEQAVLRQISQMIKQTLSKWWNPRLLIYLYFLFVFTGKHPSANLDFCVFSFDFILA